MLYLQSVELNLLHFHNHILPSVYLLFVLSNNYDDDMLRDSCHHNYIYYHLRNSMLNNYVDDMLRDLLRHSYIYNHLHNNMLNSCVNDMVSGL